jgi:hypothetical protein
MLSLVVLLGYMPTVATAAPVLVDFDFTFTYANLEFGPPWTLLESLIMAFRDPLVND